MKRIFNSLLITVAGLFSANTVNAQTPVYPNPLTGICNPAVPHFNVSLSGVPDSVWVSPNVTRQPSCCGDPGTGSWTFVSFTVTLDPNVAEVAVGLAPSDPGGASSGYWIDVCGLYSDRIEGGQEVCITGPGPHNFWYGKSGGNANSAYTIVQIPKPTFPPDDSVRIGCSLPLDIYGLSGITMTSGNPTYDSWLDLSDPSHPIFTPGSTAPAFIDFTISGTQIASASCGAYVTTDVIRIYIYQPLDISISPDPSNFCEGGSTQLTATVTNPVGTINYSWIDNNTNTEISTTAITPLISTPGNYTVYISDVLNRYGCAPVGVTQAVTETLAPVVNAGADDTVCATSPIALLHATVTNPGTGVLWTSSTGGTFSNAALLSPSYTASATDILNGFADLTVTAYGCQNSSDVVRIVIDKGPVYTVSTPTLLCNNSTGTVSVNITSGDSSPWTPISYFWSTSSSSGPSSMVLGAGTYSVTVVNSYGCGSNTVFTISAPPALTLVMSSTDASPTGTATGTPGGGTPPYSYSWVNSLGTPMGNTPTITGLPADYYVLTVTDNNGCQITSSTVVNDPACAGFNATAVGTDALCFGSNDGSATVTGTGGAGSTGPYLYNWLTTPGQTTITATGLTAGVYEVVVTDLTLMCRDIAIAVVGEPSQLTNTMTHIDNAIIGGTAGEATANPAGGTSPYTYSWNTTPVQITQTATGLAAGTYTVTITDDNGCSITDNVTINEPPCNNFQAAVNVTNISCAGQSDGVAIVVVAHGTAPYTYSLDGSPYALNPTGTFSGLSAGAHTLSIMDFQKCVVIQNFFITEPSVLSVGLSPNDMSCYGSPLNGSIDLTVSGGTFPYSFEWINNDGNVLFATTEDVIGLGVGTYSVTVTDAGGCTAQASAGVNQPSALTANYNVTDITCYGFDNGAIDVTVTGGQTPYTYSWVFPSGTSSAEDLSSLSPGQYLLTINDGNGCSVTNIVDAYLNEPAQVQIVSYVVDCPVPGDNFAPVEIDSISGGTNGPYLLSFDGGPALPAGATSTTLSINATHTVTATDANGCTVTAPTSISINPAVTVSNVTFDPCIPSGSATVNITVTPSGGDGGPYEVSTDNGITYNVEGTYVLSVPVGTTYNVVVNDTSDCVSLPFTIVVPNEISSTYLVDSVSCLSANDGSILLSANGGTAPYNVSWTGPVTGNPAGNEISISGGAYTISTLPAGMYTVTITDMNGCTRVIPVSVGTTVDLNDPAISCPGNITTNNDVNNCFALVTYGTPVGTDNCGGSTTIQTAGLASGAAFPVGVTTNTFVVTDAQGNSSTCSFSVTVIDAQMPNITCPSNVSVAADAGECFASSANVTLGTPLTSDNCSVASVTNDAPVTYSVGTTIVTWTVTDVNGNSSTCTQNVVVTDNEIPVITACPVTINANTDNGFCYATGITLGTLFADDNCGVATITNNAPASFPVGTTTVVWTVTDVNGNSVTCNQDVVVTDNQLPTITCPLAITQTNDNGACGSSTVTLGTPLTGDNCGVATVTNDAPAFFPVGTTTVTWTVTDVNGNSAQCTQLITITDDENPVLVSCPADVAVNADPGDCYANSTSVSLGMPVATDNCSVATITNDAPVIFPVGTTVVTWTITDINGNSSTCTQNVVVADVEIPVITTCPSTVNVNADNGFCYASGVVLGTPVATDNCSISTITSNAPSTYPIGTTTVIWTVTDVNGNSVTCNQDVVVTDNQLPTITCPLAISQTNDNGACGSSTVNLGTPLTGDNCGVATVTNDAPAFFPVGTTTVTWTVTDVNGNSAQCTQLVIITDDENPVLVSCPVDLTVPADAGNCFADAISVPLGMPVATDNCSVATIVNDAPSTFPVGNTVVTWTITDINGNNSICIQNITVVDSELPVITTCPATVNVNADNGFCYASGVVLGTPAATDNCAVSTITNNAPSTYPVGTTTVIWTVTDVNGNSITCSQDVVVADTQAPSVICPAPISQSNDNGACGSSTISLGTPSTLDNCAVATITNDAPAFFPVGTTTVTWTVTDVNGNSTQCTQLVTITDDESPVIVTCEVDQIVQADADCEFALADYTASITATDNCGYTISQSPIAGTIISTGTTTVVITVADNAGNEITCSFEVTVNDTISPVITGCPSDLNVNNDAGNCGAVVTWTEPIATDNCGVTFTSTYTSGDVFPVGTTTVTYTATDAAGNSSICTFDVTVTDNEVPVIVTCQADISSCDSLVTFNVPVATDNCGVDTIIQTAGLPSGSIFPVGITPIEFTITDVNGNSSTCNFNVTINPTPELSLVVQNVSCFGADNGSIDLTVTSGTSPFTFDWSDLSTTEDISNLAPGQYSVTVVDTFGCTSTIFATVTQPMVIELNETHVNVNCYDESNASIDVSVAGGTLPYSYVWSSGDTTQDVDSLTQGVYEVFITDANGCTDSISITITQPDSLIVSSISIPAVCSANDGIIDITVIGGIYPFTYSWTGGSTTEDLVNYPTGTYSVVVTDDHGCTVSYTDSIGTVSNMTLSVISNNVGCFGDSTGTIDVTVENGTGPFNYTWSSGDTTQDLSNLTAGTYTISVVDSNLCHATLEVVIEESPLLELSLVSPVDANGFNISSYGGENGSIDLTITGGAAPFNVLWVETGDTSEDPSSLQAGTYTVVVTDANGCFVSAQIVLTEPFELAMPTGYTPNGDGANDYFVVKGIEAFPDNEIKVYNRWGNVVYKAEGYYNEWDGRNNSGEELPDGTYYVVLVLNGTDIEPLTGYVDLRRSR